MTLHSVYYSPASAVCVYWIYIGWSWLGFYIIYYGIAWYGCFPSYWSPCFYVLRFSKMKNLGCDFFFQSTELKGSNAPRPILLPCLFSLVFVGLHEFKLVERRKAGPSDFDIFKIGGSTGSLVGREMLFIFQLECWECWDHRAAARQRPGPGHTSQQ